MAIYSQDCMWATKMSLSPLNAITVKRSNPFQQVYQHFVNKHLFDGKVFWDKMEHENNMTWQFDPLWGTVSVAHPIPSHIHFWEYIANQPMLDEESFSISDTFKSFPPGWLYIPNGVCGQPKKNKWRITGCELEEIVTHWTIPHLRTLWRISQVKTIAFSFTFLYKLAPVQFLKLYITKSEYVRFSK